MSRKKEEFIVGIRALGVGWRVFCSKLKYRKDCASIEACLLSFTRFVLNKYKSGTVEEKREIENILFNEEADRKVER